jgi:porin
VELGWLPTFGGGTLPGSYKIGAWYDTSNPPNVIDIMGTVAATNPGVPVISSQGATAATLTSSSRSPVMARRTLEVA